MAKNVSDYHENLMASINNKGSFTLPPAFESLLKSTPSLSPSLAKLLGSIQNVSNITTTNSSDSIANLLNNNTMLLDPTQAGIAAASLGVAAQASGLASGISYTVSGGLATIATTLGLILAEIGTLTGPAGFVISELQFGSTLYNDMGANSGLITAASNKIVNLLQSFDMAGTNKTIADYLSQLHTASNLLQAATKRFSNL